tara:strand:+ start:186 stop:599 length:414 start_codon:yes stop_codon:yes gene_type:complete
MITISPIASLLVNSKTVIAVMMGGTLGASARWGLLEILPQIGSWPWQIFLVNVTGSAILGGVIALWSNTSYTAVFLGCTSGFCSAFTTFSAFSVDLAQFIRDDNFSTGISYLIASCIAGLSVFLVAKRGLSNFRVSR